MYAKMQTMDEIYDGLYKDITIKSIAQDEESYGIVLGDIHQGNFKIDSGKPTFYDFDMTTRSHYAVDLGTMFVDYMYESGALEKDPSDTRLEEIRSKIKSQAQCLVESYGNGMTIR